MGRSSLQRLDYVTLGNQVGLELLDRLAPYTVFDKANWKCVYCGKLYNKTYRALQARPNGCSCQNKMTLTDGEYNGLGRALGIEFVGPRPANIRIPTKWKNKRGDIVECTYKELAYRDISKQLKQKLGILESDYELVR